MYLLHDFCGKGDDDNCIIVIITCSEGYIEEQEKGLEGNGLYNKAEEYYKILPNIIYYK
jgi:hypothetical protein